MKICYYQMDVVDSTNDWAKRHIEELDPTSVSAILADCQTKGRGRWGRSWMSPAGKNIYLTLAFQTEVFPFIFSQLMGLVLEEFLKTLGIEAKIKWPNDILALGSKIAGILVERLEGFVLLGVGLNVNMNREDLRSISQDATSIACLTGKQVEIEPLIHRLVELFVDRYEKEAHGDFSEVKRCWHEKVKWMISRDVTIQTAAGRLKGRIAEIRLSGSIVVETEMKKKIELQSCDIEM